MSTKSRKTLPGAPETNFIREIVKEDLRTGKHRTIVTRFPPEPNGYLHIGHAKAICLNFGLAEEFGGVCNLRFDDTNPEAETPEFVEAIKRDVRWLGFDFGDREYYASDYFDKLYEWAEELVKKGLAYVDHLTEKQIREYRGNFYKKGIDSPYRNRSVQENLDLLRRMKAGEFDEGECVLRAKIDMGHENLYMRDPVIYRIKKVSHHRTKDRWCIYPMYDFAHPLSDAIEGVTHSLCTLEFEVHRPIYDWFVEHVSTENRPRQFEFARLNLSYTVMSKRLLARLVNEGIVDGWDDPRLPTLAGLRRRGVPPEAIRMFCERIGVSKNDSMVDIALLEHAVREVLEDTAPRAMCVLRPLKLVIENYPPDAVEELEARNHPTDDSFGVRTVPFRRELYIERDDFAVDPPKKWFRLAPGRQVRLRYAYIVRCTGYETDPETGEPAVVKGEYDPATRGGRTPGGRKVKGTIHWVSAEDCGRVQVRLYDRLFTREDPLDVPEGGEFLDNVNPDSLRIVKDAACEPSLLQAQPGDVMQFERVGYFCVDTVHSIPGRPVFNRVVPLRDTWKRIAQRMQMERDR